ncbi:MAG: hypothetical protein AAB316_20810, partial [Bacteroidota bacterium]
WKEFLRQAKAKLALAAVLFLALAPFIDYDTGIRCIRAPCPSAATSSVLVYAYHALIVFPNTSIYAINYPLLALGLVLSYLLSCMLAALYSKLAKKPSKKY